MRKSTINCFLLGISISLLTLTSCVDDKNLLPPPVADQSFVEEFDTTASALARGWKFVNSSDPKGGGVWQQGGEVVPWFNAFSNTGNNAGFIGADFSSTSAQAGEISNWLVSPVVTVQNGDKIIFYTRAYQLFNGTNDSTDYANRLQVCLNLNNETINTGYGDDPGDFNTLLLDINPFYVMSSSVSPKPTAYPTRWTRFEATVTGLNFAQKGRFGLRYFVEGGGSNGLATGVGIDRVSYISINHK